MKILERKFYQREPKDVAKDLLGKLLVREISGKRLMGIIVETEAYLSENDLAAHSSKGQTIANASLFLDGGHAYVHRIHNYHCLDAVCQTENIGGSVLIRALEPLEGIDRMKEMRGKDNPFDLTSGPGKLCISLDINKTFDGVDLTDEYSDLKIYTSDYDKNHNISVSKRVGISKSKHFNLRFTIAGNKFVSK